MVHGAYSGSWLNVVQNAPSQTEHQLFSDTGRFQLHTNVGDKTPAPVFISPRLSSALLCA